MGQIENALTRFADVAAHPKEQLLRYREAGKKCIGVMPYFVPEELVIAAGMVPFGLWGSNDKTIARAKEYCASFYCSIAQLDLEMLLDGTLDLLDGIITPSICDTLRPMTQNIRAAMGDKLPCIFLAHPQNRRPAYGIRFCVDQYTEVKRQLEGIAGAEIPEEALRRAIVICNRSRAARRAFVRLAGQHCDMVSARARSAVLKAAWFMDQEEYARQLEALNAELERLPAGQWTGGRVLLSGIVADQPALLKLLEDNQLAVVADDVAQESRSFRVDAREEGDPMTALAEQFAAQDYDVLLYDAYSAENRRGEYVARLARESGAQGVIILMQQFCDPEEMEYPSLKKALDEAGLPSLKLGVDQQMRDFGQASTAIQAFADLLSML